MKKFILTFLLFYGCASVVEAQKYLVLFTNKTNSPYAVNRPEEFLSARSIARRVKQNIKISERDLPPNPAYIKAIQEVGGKVWYKSRWMNGVLVEANQTVLASILKLSFVKGIDGNSSLKNARVNENQARENKFETINSVFSIPNYGASQNQLAMLGADKMHEKGFHGEGMLVGILDAGFMNADKLDFFKDLFTENRIVGTYDFVQNEKSVYEDHPHGTECLSCLTAYQDGQMVGTAYKASYLLLRTEDAATESRLEEANWLFGAEYADSVGVDVISSSLGYTTFDDATQNHTYQDMNGDKTLVTRAAEAAANAGILVVNAAGNEGSDSWHYISAPSDADSIITVGAVNSVGTFASFSSYGPSYDGRIKPDLAAQGQGTTIGYPSNVVGSGSGTSFATPLLAGLAVGFWQAFPTLNAQEVRKFLVQSGSQYSFPDDKLGYGIPNFEKAFALVQENEILKRSGKRVLAYPSITDDFRKIRLLISDTDSSKEYQLTLVDMLGKTIWSGKTTEKKLSLPITGNDFPSGVYLLKVYTDTSLTTIRLMKI